MSVPRELLKWVLSLDLSYPVKNVRREFANGFLFAEVLSRYFPADVHMHSFENVSSTERKKSNWTLLTKLFKKKGIPIEKKQIDAAMAAEGEAAVELLQQLHDFVSSSAYEESDQQYGEPSPLPRDVSEGQDVSSPPNGYAAQLDGYARQHPPSLPSQMSQQPYPLQQLQPPHLLPPLGSHPGLPTGMQGLNGPLGEMAMSHSQQQQLWQQPGGNEFSMRVMGVGPAGYGGQQAMPGGMLQPQGAGSAAGALRPAALVGGAKGRGKHVPSPLRQRPVPGSNSNERFKSPARAPASQPLQPSLPSSSSNSSSVQAGSYATAFGAPRSSDGYGSIHVGDNNMPGVGGVGGGIGLGGAGYGDSYSPGAHGPGIQGAGGYLGHAGYTGLHVGLPGGQVGGSIPGCSSIHTGTGQYGGPGPGYGGGQAGSNGGGPMRGPVGLGGVGAAGVGSQGGGTAAAAATGEGGGVASKRQAAIDAYMQQMLQARHTQEILQQQQQLLQGGQPVSTGSSNSFSKSVGDKGPLAAGGKASYGSDGGHSAGSSDIPFSKPRPVDYNPYGLKDFEDKDYNVKKAGYWELGRLGPDLATEELQAKRENQERVKAMAAQVREDNLKAAAVAAVKPKKEIPKEPTARERALQFAKNVPKPDPAKAQPLAPPQQHKGAPRKAQPANSKIGKGRLQQHAQQGQQQQQQQQQARGAAAPSGPGQGGSSVAAPERPPMSELEMLEAQHEADLKRVEEIRAQLARACK